MEPREDPEPSEKMHEIERRYDELEERLTGKHEVAAHEESEILGRKHPMASAAATHEESEILEQHTMKTAAAANDETENERHQQEDQTGKQRRQKTPNT